MFGITPCFFVSLCLLDLICALTLVKEQDYVQLACPHDPTDVPPLSLSVSYESGQSDEYATFSETTCVPVYNIVRCHSDLHSYAISIKASNITRRITGYSCNGRRVYSVQFYAPPRDVTCDDPLFDQTKSHVTIRCRAEPMFPSGLCAFYLQAQRKLSGHVTYATQLSSSDPVYYKMTCTLTLPLRELGVGRHDVTVSVYPSLQDGILLGTNTSLTKPILLDNSPATIDRDCPSGPKVTGNFIKAGSLATCLCRSKLNTTGAVWTDGEFPIGDVNDDGTIAILNLAFPKDFNKTFYCWGTPSFNDSKGTEFSPRFAYGPHNVSLHVSGFHSNRTSFAECSVQRVSVSPGAIFTFFHNGRDVTHLATDQSNTSSYVYVVEVRSEFRGQDWLKCNVRNQVFHELQGEASLVIGAAAPPKITHLTANNMEIQAEVARGNVVEFVCRAEGDPLPLLALTRSRDVLLSNVSTVQADERNSSRRELRHLMHDVTCMDTGEFTCLAETAESGTIVKQSVKVFVMCPLTLVNKPDIEVHTTTDHVVHKTTNDEVVLVLHVAGHPQPTSYQLRQGDGHAHVQNFTAVYHGAAPPFGVIRVKLRHVTDTGVTNFTLITSNGVGDMIYTFTVMTAGEAKDETVVVAAVSGVMLVVVLAVITAVSIKVWRVRCVAAGHNKGSSLRNIRRAIANRGRDLSGAYDSHIYEYVREAPKDESSKVKQPTAGDITGSNVSVCVGNCNTIDQSPDHTTEHTTDHTTDHIADHITDNITYHTTNHMTDHTTDHTTNYMTNLTTDLKTDHMTDLMTEHTTDLKNGHVTDHTTDLISDHMTDQTTDHTTDHMTDHTTDHTTDLTPNLDNALHDDGLGDKSYIPMGPRPGTLCEPGRAEAEPSQESHEYLLIVDEQVEQDNMAVIPKYYDYYDHDNIENMNEYQPVNKSVDGGTRTVAESC